MNGQHSAPKKYIPTITYRNEFQSPCVRSSRNPPNAGAANAARLPIMFIDPATVPAYFPPISMQVFQDGGIVRSLQKLAIPIRNMPQNASSRRVDMNKNAAAPRNPITEMKRRAIVTLPIACATLGASSPQIIEANPPNNNGRI